MSKANKKKATKIQITMTDNVNKIKQTSIQESEKPELGLGEMLEMIEDCLRGLGYSFNGHLTIEEDE